MESELNHFQVSYLATMHLNQINWTNYKQCTGTEKQSYAFKHQPVGSKLESSNMKNLLARNITESLPYTTSMYIFKELGGGATETKPRLHSNSDLHRNSFQWLGELIRVWKTSFRHPMGLCQKKVPDILVQTKFEPLRQEIVS